ncbi:MAG: hypothetical protein Q8P41_15560 [Pseudomonadota bacterium]|nr:hypothetical protein [Pseudomonadota bacterium]
MLILGKGMVLVWLFVGCGGVRGDQAEGLVLNEVLARNTITNVDDAGEFDDWIEIFNGGEEPVSRKDLFLSDDGNAPARWPLPEGDPIEPGTWLLVWADGQPEQGEMHAPFKIGGMGETVVFSYIGSGEPRTIDQVDFGEQLPDLAWARVPNGGVEWVAATPTPGETNGE